MQRSRWPLALLILALACGGIAGFVHLFELRYRAGDIYPAYSSLRSDPVGSGVLYQALDDAAGCKVTRNFLPLSQITNAQGVTIFYLGAPVDEDWPMEDVKSLEALANAGARVVVTFYPQSEATKISHQSLPKEKKPKKNKDGTPEEEPVAVTMPELAKRWNLFLNWRLARDHGDAKTPALTATAAIPGPERSIPWHTALYFKNPLPTQHIIYHTDADAVVLERKYGRGTFVFASDSYLLSNEAMRSDREPRLLAWLIGQPSTIIFDETHLGTAENPGIAALARKYGLEGFAAALIALAALFVWETGTPFLPPRREETGSGIIAGKDSASGFVSLLRRGIAPGRLLVACVEQWKKSITRRPEKMSATLARIDAAAAGADPVAAYQTISQILAEKK